jgi:hypothetical protein
MIEQDAKKHKLKHENRSFQPRWENYYFITNNNGKLQCLVCMQVLSVPKEFNLKRHYTSLHDDKLKKYQDRARIALFEDYKKKCKQHTDVFTRVAKTNISSLTASYNVVLELARCKKAFSDGFLVKKMCC